MSDQFNEFDQIFRDRLRDQTASPPASAWSNIQAERSFGHIVANKISSSWRIIGTILLLALAGGSSVFLLQNQDSEQIQVSHPELDQLPIHQNSPIELQHNPKVDLEILEAQSNSSPTNTITTQPIVNDATNQETESLYADPSLFASNDYGVFGKPDIEDPHLAALVDGMDGWGTAKPASMVRFYQIDKLQQKAFNGNRLVKSPMVPEKQFDYVIESTPKKGFRERASLNFYFGPQFIQKILTPEYNMTTSFLEKRLETENTRLAYTAGINLQYELKNHKFFESGLQFTQIYEEVRINGDMRFSNQYDFLEIPMLIGYRDRESKWGWSIKGGFGLQVYNNYKGYILRKVEDRIGSVAPDDGGNGQYRISGSNFVNTVVNNDHKLSDKQDRNEVYDLSSDENPYREFGIVNLHLAAGITYYHSINTSFSMSPYYRQSINSLTRENANFKERITYMGVVFGTRVNF